MSKRLFSHDPLTGMREYFHYDEVNDRAYLSSEQDVTDIVEENKRTLNEATSLHRWGDGKLVARIPMQLYADLQRRGITKNKAAFKRWLNDPDNRFFRVFPGKV